VIQKYKVFIFTEDPDKLVKFYTEALGFNIVKKLEYPEDYGYTIEVNDGGQQIWLAKHSGVSGENKDIYRHIINFYVDSIDEVLRMARVYTGVEVIQEPRSMGEIVPGEVRFVATILDPEKNCLQFIGSR
jgi:predicted enzyme related to lactoylglutathione lyase